MISRNERIVLRELIRESLLIKNQHAIDKALLREFISFLLIEDGGGGDYGGPMDAGGMHGFDSQRGYFDGFKRLFKTVQGKTEEMGQRLKNAVRVSIEAALSTTIPFIKSDYTAIREKHKSELGSIKSKYQEVYAATDKILANSDLGLLKVVMLGPGSVILPKMFQAAPAKAASALKIMSGGYFADEIDSLAKLAGAGAGIAMGSAATAGVQTSGFVRGNNLLLEKRKRQVKKDFKKKVGAQYQALMKKIQSSPGFAQFKQQVSTDLLKTEKIIIDGIQKSFKNIFTKKSIRKILDRKLNEMMKSGAGQAVTNQLVQQAQGANKQQGTQNKNQDLVSLAREYKIDDEKIKDVLLRDLLPPVVDGMKKHYVDLIKARLEKVPPEAKNTRSIYEKMISEIQSAKLK